MVVITFLVISGAVGFVCYQLGRARRLNRRIKYAPDDVAVNPHTGEVIQRGTPEWEFAEKFNAVHRKVEFK